MPHCETVFPLNPRTHNWHIRSHRTIKEVPSEHLGGAIWVKREFHQSIQRGAILWPRQDSPLWPRQSFRSRVISGVMCWWEGENARLATRQYQRARECQRGPTYQVSVKSCGHSWQEGIRAGVDSTSGQELQIFLTEKGIRSSQALSR